MAFRAHFAHKTLCTSRGVLSGSIYGFLVSMRTVKKNYPHCHFTIAWDTHSTRKKEIFADYKINRPPSSPISTHILDLKSICSCLNVSQTEYEGEEADDVMASLARIYKDDSNKIYIYTGDKDMRQLVENGRVIVVSPQRVYDEAAVKEEHGVYPKDYACFLCLRGDDNDDVPGVPRVRSTRLAYLVEKYRTLEAVFDNLPNEKLTDYELESLVVFKSQSFVNKQLVLLRDDLQLEIQTGFSNTEKLATYLDKYEIKVIKPDTYVKAFDIVTESRREVPKIESYSLFE